MAAQLSSRTEAMPIPARIGGYMGSCLQGFSRFLGDAFLLRVAPGMALHRWSRMASSTPVRVVKVVASLRAPCLSPGAGIRAVCLHSFRGTFTTDGARF